MAVKLHGAIIASSGSVGSGEIANDSIVNADINSAAAIAFSKLAALTAGSVLIGNSSNVPTAVLATLTAAGKILARVGTFTATISNASPGVVTSVAHGLLNGDVVVLTTTGALPTGLSPSTAYYVVNKGDDTFQLSATLGGTAINTSSAGSGVHTVTYSGLSLRPLSVGDADIAAAAVTTTKLAGSGVTGAKLSTTFGKVYSFTGFNGAGACTLTGAAVGDRVVGVAGITTPGNAAASFESVITIANQIQQSSGSNLSAETYSVLLIPASA